jgi:hypothetical protein
MAAARTAAICYPEEVAAIEKAAGPALEVVDAVLMNADAGPDLYRRLDEELAKHCDRVALQAIKDKK